ncbi:hypothetical protein ONZ45_g181 [Pleurotus djamor]|nr:hypothetical protein ONZ45_g181 [Pleurotus djamor]
MAASSSKQPQNVPITKKHKAHAKATKISRKGKGKEQQVLIDTTNTSHTVGGEEEGPLAWNWVSLTDTAASKYPPIFTKDGSYFFSLVGPSVKVYSTSTGQIVSTLTAPCPEGKQSRSQSLTCAVLNPQNAFQLITGSLSGCIAVWDFMDASLLQILDIEKPVLHICIHESLRGYVFVTATKGKSDDSALVLRVPIQSDTPSVSVQKPADIYSVGKIRSPTGLSFSPNGDWLVAVAGHTSYVASISALDSGFTKYVSPDRLTCLAFHPSENYFATGDEKGCIRLWYCLNDHQPVDAVGVEKKSQTSSFHWHAHAVSAIAFSSNGAYLLSGGEESVLVIWQLHTGRKEFVPRVGAPINAISVCNGNGSSEEYLLGLTDASYVFVNPANLKISRVYSRIKLESSGTQKTIGRNSVLAQHRPTSTILLPSSHPSSLQIFSPSTLKLVSELEVAPSNRVSRRDDTPCEPYRVDHVAVSTSGEWMATIDSRAGDSSFRRDVCLKFWKWDRKSSSWILNTRIEKPHALATVASISFKPSDSDNTDLQLASAGEDGNVKLWRIRSTRVTKGTFEESWATRSILKYKDNLPTHTSWAPDGSLLAVSFGPHVVVYDAPSTTLLRTLTTPQCRAKWRVPLSSKSNFLVPHPTQDAFVLATADGDQPTSCIRIFRADSPSPVVASRVPHSFRAISWSSLGTPSSSKLVFVLLGITHAWSLIVMGNDTKTTEGDASSGRKLFGDLAPPRTLFEDVFGKSAFGRTESHAPPDDSGHRPRMSQTSIVSDPAYQMSSFEAVFDKFISTITRTRLVAPIPSSEPLEITEDEGDLPDSTMKTRTTRVVDRAEMDVMTQLFKRQSLGNRQPPPPSNGHSFPYTNGKTNGVRHSPLPPNQNGILPSKKPVKSTSSVTVDDTSSPMPSGRKRKKSLG